MPAKVTLTVVDGPLRGEVHHFTDRTTAILGRAADCAPQLPDDDRHRTVSRHHCLLDVNPPDARVRDFGSLNGTYLNGTRIGRREPDQTPEQGAAIAFPEHDLHDGDEVRLGDTVYRVGIEAPARLTGTRVLSCCAHCGREVTGGDTGRDGELVCETCRGRPEAVLRDLLERAGAGESRLAPLAGYTLLGELGAGGMGRVYLAEDRTTYERVALKMLIPAVVAEQEARARFLREISVTLPLDHPHIARLHHVGSADGIFFFTSEYCAGGNLRQHLVRQGGTLPAGDAVALTLQILDGLAYAHEQGIVHRDLTPHNVLLTGDPQPVVKLADFGLGKAFDQAGLSGLTRTGTAAGKPYFMPYQQVVNFRHAGPPLDVWAAAACLYHMLTGDYPRDFSGGRDPWQVVLQSEAVPVRKRRPDLPGPLADVIDTALRDRPEIGFATAGELRRALVLRGL